jgi:alpha-tubulin suppressor-like RCC1 family protein
MLGAASLACSWTPTKVAGIPPAVDVVSGGVATCARGEDDSLHCWGDNGLGQGGHPDLAKMIPAPVAGLSPPIGSLSLGPASGPLAGAVAGGGVFTWGSEKYGSLGRDAGSPCAALPCPRPVPGLVVIDLGSKPAISGAVEVQAGSDVGMARTSDRRLFGWGHAKHGVLLDGSGDRDGGHALAYAKDITPLLPGPPDRIVLRAETACILSAGDVYCWGANAAGQVGAGTFGSLGCTSDGTIECIGEPTKVALPAKAVDVSTSAVSSAALLEDGRVFAWGDNELGELGHPPGTQGDEVTPSGGAARTTPVQVAGLPKAR